MRDGADAAQAFNRKYVKKDLLSRNSSQSEAARVYLGRCRLNGSSLAIKEYENIQTDSNNFTNNPRSSTIFSIRDIRRHLQCVKFLSVNEHFVKLLDSFIVQPSNPSQGTTVFLVFELMDSDIRRELQSHAPPRHTNIEHAMFHDMGLKSSPHPWFRRSPDNTIEPLLIKKWMYQLLNGLAFSHSRGVVLRDIIPENLLLSKNMKNLKIGHMGIPRKRNKPPPDDHMQLIRCYKAPEEFFNSKGVTASDIWSAGCIFAELYRGAPLFLSPNEKIHLLSIFRLLGYPDERLYPGRLVKEIPQVCHEWKPTDLADVLQNMDTDALDLLKKMLTYDISKRITAVDALMHPYFSDYIAMRSLQNCGRR